jgi:hypothetical protein
MPTQISVALFRARFFAGSRPSLLRRRTELTGVWMVMVMMVVMVVALRKSRCAKEQNDGE